jgi:hypothetical protein
MSFWTNLFSGNNYHKTESTIMRDDGKMFYKTGSMWIDDEGTTVQQMGNNLMNLNTGVDSRWGDPFGDKE